MISLRRLGRRTAWLMAGAAIGLAVVLLVAALAVVLVGIVAGPRAVLGTPPPAAFALCTIAAVLIGALLGLVPGVRELEVTGARAMLGAHGELIVPETPRAGHRVRTVAFVVLHQLLGLAVVSLLGMVLPGGVAALVEAVTCSATAPPSVSTNCGRKARKNSAVFGLSTLTIAPCQKVRRSERSRETAVAASGALSRARSRRSPSAIR